MKTPQLLVLGASLVAAVIVGVVVASAHSFPETESPAAGETVNGAPSQVSIKYDAPIEKLFAGLQVLDPAGKDEAAGPVQVSDDSWTLSVKLNKLVPGDYTVKWHVVCIDTHHTEGSYTFTVAGK